MENDEKKRIEIANEIYGGRENWIDDSNSVPGQELERYLMGEGREAYLRIIEKFATKLDEYVSR